MFQFVSSSFTNLTRLGANSFKWSLDQVRTRTTCSKREGKEKSVKTAMARYFRLDKRVWIRSQPGYHHHLYMKPNEHRFLVQQPVLCDRKESRMVERMAGRFYKNFKVENFVDPPFVYYHQYLNKVREQMTKVPKRTMYP